MTRSPAAADVTVVVPTLGRSRFFAEALASALGETPAAVVVVEDGGERLDEKALSGARVVRQKHAGRSVARNCGVEAAQTSFVAFLDDDDVVLPGRLERQSEALQAAPDAPLTFGRVEVVDGEGVPLSDWNQLLEGRFAAAGERIGAAELLSRRVPVYTSATLVRRDAFLAVGGYDPGLDAHEDLDLYVRLARLGPLVASPGGPVAAYRLHGQNTPSDHLYEGLLALTRKHLPGARGPFKRALLAREVDALWGLGRYGHARREALRAALAEPLLLANPHFVRRLTGALLPARLLEGR